MSLLNLRSPVALLLVLCLWGTLSPARPAAFRGKLVVEDFERLAWGGQWATVRATGGADSRMRVERRDVRRGRRACRLVVPPGGSLVLARQFGRDFVGKGDKPPLPLPGRPERIGVWVRGTASGHRLWFRLLDADGRRTDVALGVVDFEGWRLMEAVVPPMPRPVGLRALLVRGGDGPLVLDDVTVTTAADQPLYLTVRQMEPEAEFVAGQPARFRVVLQSLDRGWREGRGMATAFPRGGGEEPADRWRFDYRVCATRPFERTVRLRLAAGVYTMVVRAGGAAWRRRLAIFPRGVGGAEVDARRAVRRFGQDGDALRLYQSAFSPAVLVETTGKTLTLFRGLAASGLTVPQDGLVRTAAGAEGLGREALAEPWVLLWFGASPRWAQVTFADGSPCPTFDVPFVLVFQRRPAKMRLGEEGLRLEFAQPGARVAMMPLFGVLRPEPSRTSRWKESVGLVSALAERCRFWAAALRALPIAVEEERRVDLRRDEVAVRLRFRYLESPSDWGPEPLRVAPVPPLLALARRGGLAVRIRPEPKATGCHTSLGPYHVVPEAEGYTYTIPGVLRHVNEALADLPPQPREARLSLARTYWALGADAPKIPFWARQEGGRAVAEALLRYVLWRGNARYRFDAANGRMLALDGLVWQRQGEAEAAAAVAEHLRACWLAGWHAGLWDLSHRRWHHIRSLDAALSGEAWASLGVGSSGMPFDARLNGQLFFARLAARLGHERDYAQACGRVAKLLAAGHALVRGGPDFLARLEPWPTLVGQGEDAVLGRCLPGSRGLAPGPPPFLTQPSDGGYSFARAELSEYFGQRFRGGPLGFYGPDPQAWAGRRFVPLALPEVPSDFRPVPTESGPYATNHVFEVEEGEDGWPRLVWRSHRAPDGGPLHFGGIGTQLSHRGKLRRAVTAGRGLRMVAYRAIPAPPPPKETEDQEPPPPKAPPSPPDDDTRAGTPPRNTPDSAPGTGAPARAAPRTGPPRRRMPPDRNPPRPPPRSGSPAAGSTCPRPPAGSR